MRISDWCSDVCSSDLGVGRVQRRRAVQDQVAVGLGTPQRIDHHAHAAGAEVLSRGFARRAARDQVEPWQPGVVLDGGKVGDASVEIIHHPAARSEEHTSELQSLMRISYAVFCLKKKKNNSIYIYQVVQLTTT